MTASASASALKSYGTLIEQDRLELFDMSLRHDEMRKNVPTLSLGDLYRQTENYMKLLQDLLRACEELDDAIKRRLKELEE